MFLPSVPFLEIDAAIGGTVFVLWSGVSAVQLLKAKTHRPKCFVCDRPVSHTEQAHYVPVPCHERCHFMAKLLGRYSP